MTTPKISSARRSADWLVSLMQPDGSLRGATSINDYYKAVLGLALAGRQDESRRMLDHVVKRDLREDGDLDGTGCAWFEQFRNYPHAWLLMGAVVRSRFDLVRKWADFLERYQDPDNGGFYGTREGLKNRGEQDLMSSGVAAIALLWAGRIESALKTGQWIRKLYEAQPNLFGGFYFVWDRQKGLMTKFPADKAVEYHADASKPAVVLRVRLRCRPGRGPLRSDDLGRRYLEATRHCQEDVYRQGTSGKIGWGASWLYRMTRDPADRAIAEKVRANLEASQHEEGWWSVQNIYSRDWSQKITPQVDVTGEFAALMSWMENILQENRSCSTTA